MPNSDLSPASPELSKRAARRLIQRAFVLVGRDRRVREHIREAHLTMLWVLEDWGFEWTVVVDRGRLQFDRRPARKPDLTVTWREATVFFQRIEDGGEDADDFKIEGKLELRKFLDLVYRAFRSALHEVLRYPFDDEGVRIA